MSLTSHPYRFFTEETPFLQVWRSTFDRLAGDRILSVLGVWDLQDHTWFDDAPMLVELTSGVLSVKVSGENRLAVGWNDILPKDAPVWLDEEQLEGQPGLDWTQDLRWRAYEPVRGAFGKCLEGCAPYCDPCGLRGLRLTLSGGVLQIGNGGDVISAVYQPAEGKR